VSGVRADLRRTWRRSAPYRPRTATGWIVALTALAYVVEILSGGWLINAFAYVPLVSEPATSGTFQPWRMLTSLLVHQPIGAGIGVVGISHILFNMYSLYLFGRPLEDVFGPARLTATYLISGLAGSVLVLYWSLLPIDGRLGLSPNTFVYGASGAVFGVLGAVVVVQRRLGIDVRVLYLFIAINFALGFILGGVAWQAHLGGLLVGALTGWLFVRNRGPRRDRRAFLGAAGIAAVLVLLAFAPAAAGL
jgi:membrane associated rhomboid family serine protease